jgi:hypothetical protein
MEEVCVKEEGVDEETCEDKEREKRQQTGSGKRKQT